MNNKVPQINVVFDRRKKASLTKKASVELRITHNYKQKWISTGIMLYSNQWKDGKIVNCPNILEISHALRGQRLRVCMAYEGVYRRERYSFLGNQQRGRFLLHCLKEFKELSA